MSNIYYSIQQCIVHTPLGLISLEYHYNVRYVNGLLELVEVDRRCQNFEDNG